MEQGEAIAGRGAAVRILALMEACSVTGPAKNLIEFGKRASQWEGHPFRAEISVLTYTRRAADEGNGFIEAVRSAGLPVWIISEKRAFDPGVLPQLRALAGRIKPDIIQSHSIKSHFLVRFSGLARQYPWVAFHHGYTATDVKMRVYNQLDRWSLREARQVVTVCRAFAADLEQIGVNRERITIRHNMVTPFMPPDPDEVAAARKNLGLPSGCKVILCVGRLSAEKGHADLLRAVAALLRLRPPLDFRVILAGDGPERGPLERLAGELQITQHVIFAGHIGKLAPFYALADVLVLPSYSEGSPNVLLEAMSAGVPVVATSVGGVPEIAVHEENALLVPKQDTVAMAREIARLLGNPELANRLARSGRQVVQQYTPDEYTKSVLGVYAACRH